MDWMDNNLESTGPLERKKEFTRTRNLFVQYGDEYMKIFNGTEGFDIDDATGYGFLTTICNDNCSPLIILYAKTGLHRYNLLQGKNLQFISVKKYSSSTHSAASRYFITLEAKDPSTHSLQTFQTKVSEEGSFGEFHLVCIIARPLGETKRSDFKERSINPKALKNFFRTKKIMPEWPTENPFENSKRCHVLKKSELQENDWIRLYLELAVAMTNRHDTNDLSNLKILKVAIVSATTQDVAIKVATFYIRYKDSCQARVGKDVDRVAIIRRGFIEGMGYFRLMGQTMSSRIIIPKKVKKQLLFSLRLKQLLLLTPGRLKKPFKYNGVGLSGKKRSVLLSPWTASCKYNGVGLSGKKRSMRLSPWPASCKYNGVGSSGKKRNVRLSPSPRQSKACKYNGVGLSGKNAECATSS